MKISSLPGIGAEHISLLRTAKITTTERLLKIARSEEELYRLSAQTGISKRQIMDWVNRADLLQLRGVGEEYGELLEQAGIDSVASLRQHRPHQLHRQLVAVNIEKNLVGRVPSIHQVRRWIGGARSRQPVAEP